MKKTIALLGPLFALSCNMGNTVNPTGLPCDVGNVCPSGYQCLLGECQSTGGVGGGFAGQGGGTATGGGSANGGGINALCLGVVCDQVPAATCTDASTLRSFVGSCDEQSGSCTYPSNDAHCSMGCTAGACVGDPCVGKTCNMAPAAACLNGTTLRVYTPAGTCSAGVCMYTPNDTTCTNGCDNNMCRNQDLCMGVTCNTPPAPTCAGNTLITAGAGTCADGVCNYSMNSMVCPGACTAGACVTTSLNFSQVMPRVPIKVLGIDVKPGSTGDEVLAVGAAGAVYQWNGTAWSKLAVGHHPDAHRRLVLERHHRVDHRRGPHRAALQRWRHRAGGAWPARGRRRQRAAGRRARRQRQQPVRGRQRRQPVSVERARLDDHHPHLERAVLDDLALRRAVGPRRRSGALRRQGQRAGRGGLRQHRRRHLL